MTGPLAAERLRTIRESLQSGPGRRLSADLVADAIGMKKNAYLHYETGYKERFLRLDLVDKLAIALARFGADPREVYALAGLTDASERMRERGLRDVEMVPYGRDEDRDTPLTKAVRAFCEGHPARDPWLVRGRAMQLEGYRPGDVVIVDLNRTDPRRRQVICVQITDPAIAAGRTLLRLYEPPYAVAASTDPAYAKPELIDGDTVQIMGSAVAAIRVVD